MLLPSLRLQQGPGMIGDLLACVALANRVSVAEILGRRSSGG